MKFMTKRKPFIYVHLEPELKEQLKKEAKRLGIPLSVLVRLRLQGELPVKSGDEGEASA